MAETERTFSSSVKAELCRVPNQKPCCAVAEAYGILLHANTFSTDRIKIITGSEELAQRLPKLFRRAFSVTFDTLPDPGHVGKFIFTISDRQKIDAISARFGYDARYTLAHHVNLGVLEDECCKAAFLRGAFLSGGSMTSPDKRLHLEIVTAHMSVSRETYAILLDLGFEPRSSTRGGNYLTYFKSSEAMEDLLTLMGASASAMELMSAKIEKTMRSAVNRQLNCDSANVDKTVMAAQQQLERIRALDREIGIPNLPEDLQNVAMLRIANPEASLTELALLAYPPVSRSTINYRMKKLMTYEPE